MIASSISEGEVGCSVQKKRKTFEVASVDVNLRGLILPMGLRVDSVKLSGDGLQISYSPFKASSKEPANLEVFVSEQDLSSFLNNMPNLGLKNISVEAKDGTLHIRATKTVLIDVKAYAVCSLRIQNSSKLFIDLESVEILGVGPKHLIQSQLDKINPIVDVEDFPIQATLDSVEISNGGIILRGRAEPPE